MGEQKRGEKERGEKDIDLLFCLFIRWLILCALILYVP